jgi:hypothetical protein
MDYFLYLVLGFLILYVEFSRKKYFLIDHLSLFHAFFFLVYVFTPLALIFYGEDVVSRDLVYGKYYLWKNPWTAWLIFASYLAFLAGYYWQAPRQTAKRVRLFSRISEDLIMRVMPFVYLFLVGIVFIYVQGEGGLAQAINNAELYRSGVIFAKYGFLTRLFPLNQILLFYFFYRLFLKRDRRRPYASLIYFTISVILFLIMVALANSRGFMILTLLGIYIMTAIYYRSYFWRFLIVAVLFGYGVIKYGDPLFHAIPDLVHYGFDTFFATLSERIDRAASGRGSIIANFTHPIVSLEVSLALSGSEVAFRYFVDFLQAVVAIVPSALVPIEDPKYVMILNTELMMGEEVSTVLPGILALFSYSLHGVGMLIGMFLYGMLGGILSEIFKSVYTRYRASLVFIVPLIITYGYFVFRGSPRNALMSLFILLVVLAVFILFSKISYRKEEERVA